MTSIDTRPPVITVTGPGAEIFRTGEAISLNWGVADSHPSDGAAGYWARLLAPYDALDEFSYYPDITDYTWNWTAPDTTLWHCRIEILAVDAFGNASRDTSDRWAVLPETTSTPDLAQRVQFALPAPNPFNPRVRLSFALPEDAEVEITVCDARGRKIRHLLQERRPAGPFAVTWDGLTGGQRRAPAGMYLFVLRTRGASGETMLTRKAVLLP